jgi:hypothetical protein
LLLLSYMVSISYLSKWGGILTMVSRLPRVSVKGKLQGYK